MADTQVKCITWSPKITFGGKSCTLHADGGTNAQSKNIEYVEGKACWKVNPRHEGIITMLTGMTASAQKKRRIEADDDTVSLTLATCGSYMRIMEHRNTSHANFLLGDPTVAKAGLAMLYGDSSTETVAPRIKSRRKDDQVQKIKTLMTFFVDGFPDKPIVCVRPLDGRDRISIVIEDECVHNFLSILHTDVKTVENLSNPRGYSRNGANCIAVLADGDGGLVAVEAGDASVSGGVCTVGGDNFEGREEAEEESPVSDDICEASDCDVPDDGDLDEAGRRARWLAKYGNGAK